MSAYSRLSRVYESSEVFNFDNNSKIVLMSDCHRGDGSWNDSFAHNRTIYTAALKYYYKNGFTYIELGDGDELWKNKSISEISRIYVDIFRLLSRFHFENRLHIVYGNHDIEKRDPSYSREHLRSYYDSHTGSFEPLFNTLRTHEGLILHHAESDIKLFLIHGHQVNLLDNQLLSVRRFLVRHFLKHFEMLGFRDLTSAAKNNVKKRQIEKRISRWAAENKQLVIAGHTHRPSCPSEQDALYYNDGSCVHPNCITCLEIIGGEISLYKWHVRSRDDGTLYIGKQPIAVPRKLLRADTKLQ